jgi:hypothetical protein
MQCILLTLLCLGILSALPGCVGDLYLSEISPIVVYGPHKIYSGYQGGGAIDYERKMDEEEQQYRRQRAVQEREQEQRLRQWEQERARERDPRYEDMR